MDFDRIANRHRDAVYAQMVRLCGNHDDAEDALMSALVSAYQAMPTLRDEEAFRGWLAKIARRVCYRMRSRPESAPLIELADHRIDVAEGAATHQMRRCIKDAMEALPDGLRDVYVLRDVHRMPAGAVAAQLGLTVAATKSRLHRARRAMREQLEESPVYR
jgi:RNA polymerase sigma-70 factor (ECF subfamily)